MERRPCDAGTFRVGPLRMQDEWPRKHGDLCLGLRPGRSPLARTVGCSAARSAGRVALQVLAALPLSPPQLCFHGEFQLRERTAGDMLTMPPCLSFSPRNTKLPGFPPAGKEKRGTFSLRVSPSGSPHSQEKDGSPAWCVNRGDFPRAAVALAWPSLSP